MRIAEADAPAHLQAERPGLHTLELDAVVELDDLDTIEHPEEVEVPPCPAELAVGGKPQTVLRFLAYERGDLGVFHLAQGGVVDLSRRTRGAGLGEGCRSEETADDVGAVGKLCIGHTGMLLRRLAMSEITRTVGRCQSPSFVPTTSSRPTRSRARTTSSP